MINDSPKPGHNYFLIMWCREGLECIIDLGKMHKEQDAASKEYLAKVLAAPVGETPIPNPGFNKIFGPILGRLQIRARVNAQRSYEIYTVMTRDDITEEDLRELFETSPQAIVDSIRNVGFKIFEEPSRRNENVIS